MRMEKACQGNTSVVSKHTTSNLPISNDQESVRHCAADYRTDIKMQQYKNFVYMVGLVIIST